MSLTLDFSRHRLIVTHLSNQLRFLLEPSYPVDSQLNYYLYSAAYSVHNFPIPLKPMFDQDLSIWFKYIQFYQSKCIQLNQSLIHQNQNNQDISEFQYAQLPITFTFVILQGIKTIKVKLYGQKQMFSKEKKLLKQYEQQKKKTSQCLVKILHLEELVRKYQNQVETWKQKFFQIQKENQSLRARQLPRKKVNIDPIEVPQNQSNSMFSSSQQSHNSRKSHKEINLQESKQESVIHNPLKSRASESINNGTQFQSQNCSKHNRNTNISHEIQIDCQILPNNSNQKQILDLSKEPAQKQRETNISIQRMDADKLKSHSFQNQNLNKSQSLNISNENGKGNSEKGQISNILQHQTHLIKNFVNEKCYLQVGYDDKGVKKFGFCCVLCEKVFRESQFLSKHLLMKHQNQINNDTTLQSLYVSLSNFKKRREQRMNQTQIHMKNEKVRLQSAISKLSGK